MKKTGLILGLVVFGLTSFRFGVSDEGTKPCKTYIPVAKGTKLAYENYDAKDKLQGTDSFEIKDIIETGSLLRVLIHSEYSDPKGKNKGATDFEYTCENGVFKMSLDNMISPEMMEGMEGMEIEVTQSELQMPNNMKVGQSLPDAEMVMIASMNGSEIMRMTYRIKDRKVEAQESITTAAGTFDCLKISQTSTNDMMFMSTTYRTVDWIALNVGSVRSETYDDNDKLMSYRVLTNITTP